MKMPFARWENFRECELEMIATGHDEESAKKICGAIQERAEKGELHKSLLHPLQVLSKAEDDELVVGGYATWEIKDSQNDVITTEAQVKYLQRLFQLPLEYRNITVKHSDFKIGTPILKYIDKNGKQYFSHVNEKGTYLISKIRDDKYLSTKLFREDIRKGVLSMYSISGLPLPNSIREVKEGQTVVKYHTDIEPWAVTLCEEAICPKAQAQVISKHKFLAKQMPRSDEERAKTHFNITDEEWNKLTEEQKKMLISKLPPRGSAQQASKQKTGATPGIEYDVVKITAVPNQIVLVERGKEISKAEIEAVLAKHGFNKSIKKS